MKFLSKKKSGMHPFYLLGILVLGNLTWVVWIYLLGPCESVISNCWLFFSLIFTYQQNIIFLLVIYVWLLNFMAIRCRFNSHCIWSFLLRLLFFSFLGLHIWYMACSFLFSFCLSVFIPMIVVLLLKDLSLGGPRWVLVGVFFFFSKKAYACFSSWPLLRNVILFWCSGLCGEKKGWFFSGGLN